MFFVRAGSLLAWLGFVFGVFQLAAGFWLGFNLPIDDPDAMAQAQAFYDRRYGATTGEMVTRGMYLILGSVVLGILAKIAQRQ
ncbi:hypothetical protein U0C82_07350 [Fulvimarina sp. 2208YS6-2-32]|uniref:DUF4149 domain-containing protein n=1 Tax=Fulvimarina uroteuthidis TaxID=3098149 RepID=A0ABU5I0P6_9HYPH|nr:hypothetical protein [Fulvimarina sp. 2208YS6-2-32]MDY8108960.1 hypothetical protein [Fulvimarina sp. 2208YS6-2-32]